MIRLAIKLLGIARWLKDLALRYPWQAALILALGWGAYERHTAHKWEARAVACQTASDTARKAQEALRTQERAQYQEEARHADEQHTQALADARSATDRYIVAHRVRPARHISAAEPVSEAPDASQPEAMPTGLVMVAETDVRNAAEWQAYGVTCHDYLLTITGN